LKNLFCVGVNVNGSEGLT